MTESWIDQKARDVAKDWFTRHPKYRNTKYLTNDIAQALRDILEEAAQKLEHHAKVTGNLGLDIAADIVRKMKGGRA